MASIYTLLIVKPVLSAAFPCYLTKERWKPLLEKDSLTLEIERARLRKHYSSIPWALPTPMARSSLQIRTTTKLKHNHAIRILDRTTGILQTLRLFEIVPGSEEVAPTTYATVQVKPGKTSLYIQWALPEGFKLNPQYAGILEITLQNEGVSSSFSATPDAESILLPLKQGAGVLTIQGKVVYCKEDETECKLAPIHVQIPLEITPATPTDKLNIPVAVES